MAVKKLEGVDSVAVSLNQGLAVITFKADNRVTVEQVREAVRRNGFTPKAADVQIQGTVVERAGRLALLLPGQDRVYTLLDPPDVTVLTPAVRRTGLGKLVLIHGSVPETRRDQRVEAVQVRSVTVSPDP